MNKSLFVGYCGLDCTNCEARKATINNDQKLKEEVAQKWSKLNKAEITAGMIACEGCKLDGVKTPFCDHLCPVKICAKSKKLNSCAECKEKTTCQKLEPFLSNEIVRKNILDK